MSGSLDNSPSQIVANLLVDLDVGTDYSLSGSWPVYYSGEPDTPDNLIVVYDVPSIKSGRFQYNGEVQEHHGLLIKVRSTNHATGYAKARAIAIALDENVNLAGITINSNVYKVYAVSRTSDVISLGKDHNTNNLNLFTIDVVASIRQTT